MPTQLDIYNQALADCNDLSLATLTENAERRYVLDRAYNLVFFSAVLEAGQWNFATCASQFDYNPSVEPPFGYQFVFDKPTDWVRTSAMCSDPYYRVPLNQMADQNGVWLADIQTIFVKYTSNDPNFGLNIAGWPPSFFLYACAWLAHQIIGRLANTKVSKDDLKTLMDERLQIALSNDAISGPTKFIPPGTWTSSRYGYGANRPSLWNGQGYTGG
jgi:hypothetical protein